MRHVLGVLGVLAAGVLLAVSAAMNWRFGLSLGRTELDGEIYGAASAAADCLKALLPFFFFAAIRNRVWSQAAASAVLWVVVTAYSLTSALGHAALNRFDTTGQRQQTAEVYHNLKTELARAEEKLGWIPQHRPYATVASEIDVLKARKEWRWSNGCQTTKGAQTRSFCQQYHALNAELGSADEARNAEVAVAALRTKFQGMEGTTALSEADPQAKVLADMASAVFPGVTVEHMQMAMTVFIALLLEVGSGFGMYVAFSQWRLYDRQVPAAPRPAFADHPAATAAVAVPVLAPVTAHEVPQPSTGANDNRLIDTTVELPVVEEPRAITHKPAADKRKAEAKAVATTAPASPSRRLAPETNTERFYRENVEVRDGSSVTATQLYEDYCSWCDAKSKEPSALPSFAREFAELGIKKEKVAGRVRYIGIALKSDTAHEEATKPPLYRVDAA